MTEHWAATSVAACPERVDAGAGSHSQPVWPRTRQRNWSPNRHGAWHRPWGRLGCGRSEKRSRRVARWRLTTSRRPLDGTCDQFLSRGLFRAAANFQKREYAEHEDHRSHNAEQVLRLGVSQGSAERFRIGRAPEPEKAPFAPLAPNGNGVQREGKSYSAAA